MLFFVSYLIHLFTIIELELTMTTTLCSENENEKLFRYENNKNNETKLFLEFKLHNTKIVLVSKFLLASPDSEQL